MAPIHPRRRGPGQDPRGALDSFRFMIVPQVLLNRMSLSVIEECPPDFRGRGTAGSAPLREGGRPRRRRKLALGDVFAGPEIGGFGRLNTFERRTPLQGVLRRKGEITPPRRLPRGYRFREAQPPQLEKTRDRGPFLLAGRFGFPVHRSCRRGPS